MNDTVQFNRLCCAYADAELAKPISSAEEKEWVRRFGEAHNVLRWLLKDHAVAEKDKVRNLYRALENDLPHIEKDDEWVVNEAMERMEKIFGKELFNDEI